MSSVSGKVIVDMSENTEMRSLICVVCPRGCRLSAELDHDGKLLSVTGNSCPRGKSYAASELTDPRRTLTTTVFTEGSVQPLLPVRTSRPIPKARMFEAMAKIRELRVAPPINRGDAIIVDFLERGVNLVAASELTE